MDNSIEVNLDALGRVTIPIQYRREIGIHENKRVRLKMEDNKLIIFGSEENIVKSKIKDIKEVAFTNNTISETEYQSLCDILDKLQ